MSNTVEIIITSLSDTKDEDLVSTIKENVLPKIQNNFLMRTLMGTISERKVLNDFLRDFILQELQELATWNRSKHKQMEDPISKDIILEPVIVNKITGGEIPNLTEEGVCDRRTVQRILANDTNIRIKFHELEFEKSRLEEYVRDFYKRSFEKIHLFFIFCDFVQYEPRHTKPLIPKIRDLFVMANKLCCVQQKPANIVELERSFFTRFGNPKEKFDIIKLSFNALLEKDESEGKDEEVWKFYKDQISPFFQAKEEVEGENEEGEEELCVDAKEDPLDQLIKIGNRFALDFHLDALFKEKRELISDAEMDDLIKIAGKKNEKYLIKKCMEMHPTNAVLKNKVLKIAMEEGDDDLFIKYCGEDKVMALRLMFKTMYSLSKRVQELEKRT